MSKSIREISMRSESVREYLWDQNQSERVLCENQLKLEIYKISCSMSLVYVMIYDIDCLGAYFWAYHRPGSGLQLSATCNGMLQVLHTIRNRVKNYLHILVSGTQISMLSLIVET